MRKGCFTRQSLLMKAISLVLVVAFINNFILPDAWAAVDAGKAPYEMSLQPESGFARLDVEMFTVPAHLGEVMYSFKGSSGEFIVHIQDAHCNVFAQRKVADLIDYLSKEHGIESVNLEGGAGEYDLEIFTSITGKAIRREVAEYFVKKGEINGAEFYAINNPGKVQLWGIENKNLYLANLKVYRESLTYKPEVEKYLKELTHILNNLKRHIYTPELLKVDMAYSAYKAGNMDFREYLEFLVAKAKELAVPVKQFENLYLLFQAMNLEEEVDFKKANTERSVLIGELKDGLSKNEARELVTMTVDFKTKKISRKAFYSYLLKKANGLGLDVSRFEALSNYIVYVSTYEAADRSKVMEEMDSLEAKIKGKIYRNDTERELNVLSKNLALMKNIFDIALSKTDYTYYLANRRSFDIGNYLRFIDKEAPRYKISAQLDPGIKSLDEYRERISKFYEYSFKRDDVFMKNLRFSDTAGGIKGTILMTGGFHTENLCDIFRKKGISYVSILPKFTIEKDYESPYFDILAGETTNLQQMLRSVIAQAAMLQVASLLSSILARAVWGDAGVYAFKGAVLVQESIAQGKRVALLKNDGTPVIAPDGTPMVFGEGKGEIENITIAGLLAEAGYTGEVAAEVPEEEVEREEPPSGPTEISPAIRAWQSALLGVLPATTIVMGSAMVIMAGVNAPLMFLLHTVLSFQALLMAYQTLRAYAIERDPKREGKPAASSDEVYAELRDKFGPTLAPIVDFHERVHNWSARRGIKEGSWTDEFIAYGAAYIASPFLALFYAWKGIERRFFPNRIDEELLGYKTEIYSASDHKRMIKDPRWKELFPKRNIRMNRANPRMTELGGKQIVIPGAIMGGPERGSNSFRIEEELGKGGFGAAFRARAIKGRMKGRDVAVKILKPDSPQDVVIKFFQEYSMMKRLENVEGIIRPYEAGYYEVKRPGDPTKTDRYYYIVMQFADGGDLNNELKMRRAEKRVGRRDELFTEEEIYAFADRLLRTVNAMHKKGIIHADLKPANLFYVNGELKVSDFGVSRFAPTGTFDTDTLTGTTEYMPNMMLKDFFVQGNNAKYTAKTDLYAVGIILYQLLHDGKLPQYKSDEEKKKMDELFGEKKYKDWVDKKERSSVSETIRLLGKSRAHPAETSELEKFIAMLLLENEDGISRVDDAVRRISSSASKKTRAVMRAGKPTLGKAAPMATAEREQILAMKTAEVGAIQVEPGLETVDLSPPGGRAISSVSKFFIEPPEVIPPPRGLDDLAGSETADLPSRSLLANLLNRKSPWLNFVLRVLAIFSTPFHEIGHLVAAKLSNVFIDWTPAGLLFTGEIRTERAPPLVRIGGILGNLFAGLVVGIILSYSSQPPYALSSILLTYILVINIASILFEVGGAFKGVGDLAPPGVPVALEEVMTDERMGDRVAPQIGKHARVIGIKEVDGKKFMMVETEEGRKKEKVTKDIELTKSTREKGGNIESLREFLSLVRSALPPDKKQYDRLLGAFINVIDQSEPEDLPEFYTYRGEDLVEDIFGYASAKPDENLIVVNEDITRFDLAWLHELGEYLMRPEKGRLQPKFEAGRLELFLDGEMIGEAITLEGESLDQAVKDPTNPHYLLRAFQREVFSDMDKILTEEIKARQIANVLRERMGQDVWTEPGMNPDNAAKGIRNFIRDRQVRSGADDRIVVSYPGEGTRERSFLLKEGKGDLVKLDVKDMGDLYRGRFVGAEMEILIAGADPATQSPEEMERYLELAHTAEDYLNGLTRNKLMDELRRITGNETLQFEDIGKDVYITDHIEGSNKHVFKIVFKSPDKSRSYTIAVATKTEQAAGDITAYEIRELKELQKRPTQVVPRIGADKMWNGKRWFTEEFVEGKTATQLARAGELTLNMRKKIVTVLLSIAVGLKGLTPLDMHGGNFVVRDNGEVVMVDIGLRRFRLIREASANIENEEPRKKHKMLFLATLMAQYGFFDAGEDETGERTIVGSPENNHFIFEAITENEEMAEGEGLELLKEVYEYFKERQAQEPEVVAETFSDFKYRGGFRNVLYPMGISFSGTTEEMMPALIPFSNLFMQSLGSYLAKVESRRGPPEEAPAVGVPLPAVETEPFDSMRIGKGFAMDYKGETVHMRGIAPDPRIVRNYLKTLRLRNSDGSLVVPAVRKVYLPMTTMWKRGPNIERKIEEELPAETISLLRAAAEEGLFELIELNDLGDYDRASEELGADRDKFRTLLYTSLIPFMSDWAGRNGMTYLMDQVDFVKDEGKMRDMGRAMGHTLKTLHSNGIIAGDTHLGQFVVPPDGKHTYRVDLVNIHSFDELAEETIPDNVAAEYFGILNTLRLSEAAASSFLEVYSEEDMNAIGQTAGVEKAQIKTAKSAVQDLRSGVVDWIVTPGNEEMMMSAKPAVDRSASRKFRKDYGSDTIPEGYVYKAGMSDEELSANLTTTFKDVLGNMIQPEYANKKPRAIIYAPAERYDLVKSTLDKTLKDMKLENFSDKVTVLREGGIPDDGAVDEVMHVVLGKALLNYERFRKGDYEDVFGPEAQRRLADLIKAIVMDPATIDLVKDPKIIDKILDGIVELKIRAIDYEEIRDWKSAQDEILRSL